MKRFLSLFMVIIISAALSSCVSYKGSDFEAENGLEFVHAMGLGWNLGNTFDSTGGDIGEGAASCETSWGNPAVTRELIEYIKAEGFKTIRIPVTWSGRIGDAPDYPINQDWLKRIKEVVGWCLEEELFVIINLHHEAGWIEGASTDYESFEEKYTALWRQISEEFGDFSNRLIFESMNEVGFDDLGTEKGCELLNKINSEFVDTVRESGGKNAERYLLLAGYWTDIDSTIPYFKLPDGDGRLIVSVHYYSPSDFALAFHDTDWGYRETWGTDADLEYLDGQLDKLKAAYTDNGVPVIIGECGSLITDKDPASRNLYISSVIDGCLQRGICPIVWDEGHDMRLINRDSLSWQSPELESAVKDVLKQYNSDF